MYLLKRTQVDKKMYVGVLEVEIIIEILRSELNKPSSLDNV
jgi:hypothetical protein